MPLNRLRPLPRPGPAPCAPWPRPLPRALWPIKKSRPGRCTPPRASVRRPRLAEESAAILFFSWFQWGEKEEAGSGAAGGRPAAAAATAATASSVPVAWEGRCESRARAGGGAAAGGSAVGRRWRISINSTSTASSNGCWKVRGGGRRGRAGRGTGPVGPAARGAASAGRGLEAALPAPFPAVRPGRAGAGRALPACGARPPRASGGEAAARPGASCPPRGAGAGCWRPPPAASRPCPEVPAPFPSARLDRSRRADSLAVAARRATPNRDETRGRRVLLSAWHGFHAVLPAAVRGGCGCFFAVSGGNSDAERCRHRGKVTQLVAAGSRPASVPPVRAGCALAGLPAPRQVPRGPGGGGRAPRGARPVRGSGGLAALPGWGAGWLDGGRGWTAVRLCAALLQRCWNAGAALSLEFADVLD